MDRRIGALALWGKHKPFVWTATVEKILDKLTSAAGVWKKYPQVLLSQK